MLLDMEKIIIYALFAGAAVPIGAFFAQFENIESDWLKEEFRHSVIAFGGGILIAAVALVLVPEYHELRVQLAAALARNSEPIAAADEIGIVLQDVPDDTRLRWIRVSYLQGVNLPRELRAELEEIVPN